MAAERAVVARVAAVKEVEEMGAVVTVEEATAEAAPAVVAMVVVAMAVAETAAVVKVMAEPGVAPEVGVKIGACRLPGLHGLSVSRLRLTNSQTR